MMKTLVIGSLLTIGLLGCATMQDPMLAAIETERVERLATAKTDLDRAEITQYIEQKKLDYASQKEENRATVAQRQATGFQTMALGLCLMNPGNCR